MAVKTITIDLEAYQLLAAEKRPAESFSMVIKRRLKPIPSAKTLLEDLPKLMLANDTLDRVEEVVENRPRSIAESPILEVDD